MPNVLGIGGIFFTARDPEGLRAWYQQHLGMELQPWGGALFPRDRPGGVTVWSIHPASADPFAPSRAPFMLNYIVEDLAACLDQLRAEGCEVDPRTEVSELGAFGWVMDPEGHRVELWQPPVPTEG